MHARHPAEVYTDTININSTILAAQEYHSNHYKALITLVCKKHLVQLCDYTSVLCLYLVSGHVYIISYDTPY